MQVLSAGPGNVGGLHLQKQREPSLNHAPHPHTSHAPHPHSSHAPQTSAPPGVEGVIQQHAIEHSLSVADNTGARMEHPINENILNTTAAASPPNHIRSLFLSQNQQPRLNTVSPGLNLMVGSGHQGPATPGNPMHHGVASTPVGLGGGDNSSINTVPHHVHQNSDNSQSSNSSVLLHAQSPISPAMSHVDTQPTVHNYNWPTYQQQLIIGNEGYRHAVPLLPSMQVNTSSSPNQTYYRAAY